MDQSTTSPEKVITKKLMESTFINPGAVFFVIGVLIAITLIFIPFQTFVVNMGIYFNAKKKMVVVKTEAERRFRDFIGTEPEFMDIAVGAFGTDVRQITGTGIAYAGGSLFVLDAGVAAEIPWSQVRNWAWAILGWNSQEDSSAYRVDDTPMIMIHENARGRIIAHRGSGFTIVTRDIQKPEWRFNTIDEKVCVKWLEVLNQMNENALARR